jgi:hypothetical protein
VRVTGKAAEATVMLVRWELLAVDCRRESGDQGEVRRKHRSYCSHIASNDISFFIHKQA